MKNSWIPLINAVGCFLLLGVVAVQWVQSEKRRADYRALQVQANALTEQRDEAVKRADSISQDLAEMKQALMETQKAADAAALTVKQQGEELTAATTARDQTSAQLVALQTQVTQWEAAIKERDKAIEERQAALEALRKKLDEAIAQLKKAGAQ
jgi:chromosome segregation ATPase